jgi:hypothetical protein
VELDSSVAAAVPKWIPEKGWPPLTIESALSAARVRIREVHPKFDDFQLREVSLKSFNDSRIPDGWYYVFDFDPVMDGNRMYSFIYYAIVLMDGVVLLPEERSSGDGSEGW